MYENRERALWRRIQDLQAEVTALRGERDIALIDRQVAVTELTYACQLQHDPADLPTELVHALRSCAPQRLQGVWLTIADRDLHVLIDGAAYEIDPAAEDKVWTWIADHAERPPVHPFSREDMPDRLYGVGWPTGQVAVSSALSGQDVVGAYRAMKPGPRRGLVRALGMLLIPGSGGGRAVIAAVRDAQAAAAAAASAATATATSAVTTTAGSALPAFTAAAISCTAVTSCAPPISTGFTRPPGTVLVVESPEPVEVVPAEPAPPNPGRRKPKPQVAEGELIPAAAPVQATRTPKPTATMPTAVTTTPPADSQPTVEPPSTPPPATPAPPAGDVRETPAPDGEATGPTGASPQAPNEDESVVTPVPIGPEPGTAVHVPAETGTVPALPAEPAADGSLLDVEVPARSLLTVSAASGAYLLLCVR